MIFWASPHVRPMGHTRGEPGGIELTPIGVKLNGSLRVRREVIQLVGVWKEAVNKPLAAVNLISFGPPHVLRARIGRGARVVGLMKSR